MSVVLKCWVKKWEEEVELTRRVLQQLRQVAKTPQKSDGLTPMLLRSDQKPSGDLRSEEKPAAERAAN